MTNRTTVSFLCKGSKLNAHLSSTRVQKALEAAKTTLRKG